MRTRVAALSLSFLAGCGGASPEPPAPRVVAAVLPAGAPRTTPRTFAGGLGPYSWVSADAGAVAWSTAAGAIRARVGNGPSHVVARNVGASFDVGRGPDGAPTVVWAPKCPASAARCTVLAVPAAGGAPPRVLTQVPRHGERGPVVALDGAELVHSDADGDCGTLWAQRLDDGHEHELDRGRCAAVLQLDLDDGTVGELDERPDGDEGSTFTDARIVPFSGARGRVVQTEREPLSEEGLHDAITAVSLDRGALYTARSSDRSFDQLTRIAVRGGAATGVGASLPLAGGFTQDGGRQFLVTPRRVPDALRDACSGAPFDESSPHPSCRLATEENPFTHQVAPVP